MGIDGLKISVRLKCTSYSNNIGSVVGKHSCMTKSGPQKGMAVLAWLSAADQSLVSSSSPIIHDNSVDIEVQKLLL
jgi:hypothetical protein